MYNSIVAIFTISLLLISVQAACPSGPPSVDTTSGGFEYTYPYPIHYHELQTQHQTLCQAYMDVPPHGPTNSSKTIMMLHGKNFCGVTWNATIEVMRSQGYRVIVPDQIGFCKSDKPTAYQFSLQQLALNTKSILDSLDIKSLVVMGHSMGGMLSTRFTLMYPNTVERLILVDPIGLEDWKAKGVPYLSIDNIYLQERASNYTSIRTYEQSTYYAGTWSPAYDVWVNMLVHVYNGSMADQYAFDQALITDAVITQPIAYEFPLLANKTTLLIVGQKDNTAIGKQWSPPNVQAILGDYRVLGYQVAGAIGANCTLVEYPDLGHAPQISAPDRFHKTVLDWLGE
ncbi:alpha/beta-hydrolase [Rhizodiscina lignyota]|uniref:Alpha/beta-hydrolase n=1 Tax=Rhizodiscina lignyota TaxID=1504668 RepID=A0A9P4M0E5_9PEZI|nr:alpha/beta-hydrolase [Rhizodiscina lignyota]